MTEKTIEQQISEKVYELRILNEKKANQDKDLIMNLEGGCYKIDGGNRYLYIKKFVQPCDNQLYSVEGISTSSTPFLKRLIIQFHFIMEYEDLKKLEKISKEEFKKVLTETIDLIKERALKELE